RARQDAVLPLCAWLGQNIRFAVLGIAGLAGRPSAFLWTEAVWMSLLLVVLLWVHEWNATALGGLLDAEHNAYARVTWAGAVPRCPDWSRGHRAAVAFARVAGRRPPRPRRRRRHRGQRARRSAGGRDPPAGRPRGVARPRPARLHRYLHADRLPPRAHHVGTRAGVPRGVREAGGAHSRRGRPDRR